MTATKTRQDEVDSVLGDPALVEQLLSEIADARRELAHVRQQADDQLKIASQIHRSLLPGPVRNTRIHVDVRYLPIETVGDDWIDNQTAREVRLFEPVSDHYSPMQKSRD